MSIRESCHERTASPRSDQSARSGVEARHYECQFVTGRELIHTATSGVAVRHAGSSTSSPRPPTDRPSESTVGSRQAMLSQETGSGPRYSPVEHKANGHPPNRRNDQDSSRSAELGRRAEALDTRTTLTAASAAPAARTLCETRDARGGADRLASWAVCRGFSGPTAALLRLRPCA